MVDCQCCWGWWQWCEIQQNNSWRCFGGKHAYDHDCQSLYVNTKIKGYKNVKPSTISTRMMTIDQTDFFIAPKTEGMSWHIACFFSSIRGVCVGSKARKMIFLSINKNNLKNMKNYILLDKKLFPPQKV